MSTKIQWTNETWNPIIGCEEISEGCKNCYAKKMAYRLANIQSTYYYSTLLKLNPDPEAKRFVSCEPLLSDIDFPWYQDSQPNNGTILKDIDWIIAGPETGSKARPMKKEWIENIYQQCKAANVPFFDKKDTLELNIKQFPNE